MIVAITVTGKDRPGIIAAVTGAFYRSGGNLEDASMTILEGEFAMIFLAAVKSQVAFRKLSKQLNALERKLKLFISIKEIKRRLVRGQKHKPRTDSWVVSVLGKDRAGIVYHVSQFLSNYGLNITDLNSKIMGTGSKTAYALILEVDFPRQVAVIEKLKRGFQALAKKLLVTINLNPVNSEQF
jgi:glycine cleavage system transcriptional repressor